MKVNLEYNGNKVELELTAEQIKQLGIEEKKKTGWEKAEGREYFAIYTTGKIINLVDDVVDDGQRYEYGNYFTDKALAEKMAKRIGLILRMQRWADEHNEIMDWNDKDSIKFHIYYDYEYRVFTVTTQRCHRHFGQIYFSTRELAEQAIEIFGDEIIEAYIKE